MGVVPFLLAMLAPAGQEAPPRLLREFRGVWIATVDNIDWPSKRTLSTDAQKGELVRMLDLAQSLHLNAVILQVRPSADALYDSPIEPWSEYLTGKQGQEPNPYYDPLAFAVAEAHRRGIELHAWFNPYRALHPSQKGPLSSRHIGRTRRGDVQTYGQFLWMDPGSDFVQRRSREVMLDVVRRYDIDGVHIDDYFYPYQEKDRQGNAIDFPDSRSWQSYVKSGGTLSRADWRRDNVDRFIERTYSEIKRAKPWVKFGISPFGIYRPGVPAGIQAGVDQFADLYADARRWLNEGWCDYYTPQLYWSVASKGQSYPKLLDWWMEQNPKGRHMWPGNFTSRLDPASTGWPASEIADQIAVTRSHGAGGNVHFSMKAFTKNWGRIDDVLRTGVYAPQALVPASPWLDAKPPKAPKVTLTRNSDGTLLAKWQPDGDRDIRFYAVSFFTGIWSPSQIGDATEGVIRSVDGPLPDRISVIAIDRAGNESPPRVVTLRE